MTAKEKEMGKEKEYESIEEALRVIDPNLGEEERAKQVEAFEKSFLEGVALKDTLGISGDAVEFMYSQGYRFYMMRKYQEASRFFHMLYLLNPKEARFPFALAACHHHLNHIEEAVAWYLLTSLIDAESPLPYYHISDCFLKQGDKESALFFLQKTLERIGGAKEYESLEERVKRMIVPLEEEESKKEEEKKL
jgi:type III secretion system low calcium response chaperone LcrH/SycD